MRSCQRPSGARPFGSPHTGRPGAKGSEFEPLFELPLFLSAPSDKVEELGILELLLCVPRGRLTVAARELTRRALLEFLVEWPLFKRKWRTLLLLGLFQYVHGIFTQLALYMHRPAPGKGSVVLALPTRVAPAPASAVPF